MNTNTILFQGNNVEQRLAMFVAQLVREGIVFRVRDCGDEVYTVVLTGGF